MARAKVPLVDHLDQAWDRLMSLHYGPPEDSIAGLASLHAFVNEHRDETVTIDGEQVPVYLHTVRWLDGRVDQARRSNDVGWLRKYTLAIEFASTGAAHKLDLTARSLVAWRELRNDLGRPPSREELKEWVEKEAGFRFTPRQWRRVFADLAELL